MQAERVPHEVDRRLQGLHGDGDVLHALDLHGVRSPVSFRVQCPGQAGVSQSRVPWVIPRGKESLMARVAPVTGSYFAMLSGMVNAFGVAPPPEGDKLPA